NSLSGQGARKKHLEKLLKASGSLAFKVWQQWRPLVILKWVLLGLAVAAVALGFYYWREASLLSPATAGWLEARLVVGKLGRAVFWIVVSVLGYIALSTWLGKVPARVLKRIMHWRETLIRIAFGVAMCTLGWLVARVHLHVFDRLYLWHGKLKRFPK